MSGFPAGTALSVVYIDTWSATGEQFGYWVYPQGIVVGADGTGSAAAISPNYAYYDRTDVHTQVLIEGVSVFGPAVMAC